MRTARLLLLLVMTAATLQAQVGSSASQTIRLAIHRGVKVCPGRGTVQMPMPPGGGHRSSHAEDSFTVRSSGHGTKITASLNASLPEGSRLFVQVGDANDRVELSNGGRSVDVATDLRSVRTVEQTVAYTLVADGHARDNGPQTRTVVYTMTN